MFRDNSLIPTEAIRLAALGELTRGARAYGELATEVRRFTSHLVGPSLEMMGTSLELLRLEGLIAADDDVCDTKTAALHITENGRRELETLLNAHVRIPFNETNKLILALKLRYLPLLERAAQHSQMDAIIAACENEIARLDGLRPGLGEGDGLLPAWLNSDIEELERRLVWFRKARAGL